MVKSVRCEYECDERLLEAVELLGVAHALLSGATKRIPGSRLNPLQCIHALDSAGCKIDEISKSARRQVIVAICDDGRQRRFASGEEFNRYKAIEEGGVCAHCLHKPCSYAELECKIGFRYGERDPYCTCDSVNFVVPSYQAS